MINLIFHPSLYQWERQKFVWCIHRVTTLKQKKLLCKLPLWPPVTTSHFASIGNKSIMIYSLMWGWCIGSLQTQLEEAMDTLEAKVHRFLWLNTYGEIAFRQKNKNELYLFTISSPCWELDLFSIKWGR